MLFEEQGSATKVRQTTPPASDLLGAEQSRYRVKSENKQHKNTLARRIARSGR